MPFDLPVDFEALAKVAKGAGGYPVQISASDLMRNYVAAGLDVEDGLYEETTGFGGYRTRKLKIPSPSGGNGENTKSALCFDGNEMGWSDTATLEFLEQNYPSWEEANETYVDWQTLENYPTWAEANDTYVDWGTLEGYPTWAEANDTYVDWGTLE